MAEGGELLVSVGMMDPPGWIKLMIDIEQFRKSEGGTEELPGDAIAKWLSEPGTKSKPKPEKADKAGNKLAKIRVLDSSYAPTPLEPSETDDNDEEFILPGEEES